MSDITAPRDARLTKYDPVKGVLTIHAKREAEKRARRARDIEALFAAIEAKLTAQAEFVAWWDTEAARAAHGGDRTSTRARLQKRNLALQPEDFGLTIPILSKWRTRLDDPQAFRETLAHEQETARRRLEFDVSLAQAQREQRRANLRPVALPPGIFRVLYADPPWAYGSSGVIGDGDNYGRAERHYPSMSIAELCALDIRSRVADDAVLFLWVTSPLLAECWPVITAWGFQYKASIVWDKVDHNFGNYVSVRHELLLICTRGSCLPDHPTPMPDSVISIPRSSVHSQKPAEFRALIDRLYDGDAQTKVELFAREPVDGWSAWGNALAAEVA